MEFEVHTVYDPDTIRVLTETISGGQPERKKVVRRGILLAGVLCLAICALAFWGGNDLLGMLLLVCGGLLLCLGGSFDHYVDQRRQKEDQKSGSQPVTESVSRFGPSSFTVRNDRGEKTYTYADCRQLLENDRHFILMVGDRRAVALDKSGFVTGTPDDFRTFLQDTCGKAWIV